MVNPTCLYYCYIQKNCHMIYVENAIRTLMLSISQASLQAMINQASLINHGLKIGLINRAHGLQAGLINQACKLDKKLFFF